MMTLAEKIVDKLMFISGMNAQGTTLSPGLGDLLAGSYNRHEAIELVESVIREDARQNSTEFTYSFSGRKNSFGEYVVKCYKVGKHYPDGDYHTDDVDDACKTLALLQKSASKPEVFNDRGFTGKIVDPGPVVIKD